MNITFLIGNGFDIGVGIKSRFKDFFPIYKEKSKTKSDKIRQLSDEIESDYETWADFEAALGLYASKFTLKTKSDFIAQVKDFEIEFISYLKNEESYLSFEEIHTISNTMIHALTEYYSIDNVAPESNLEISKIYSKYKEEEHIYNFINFNYTDILERCLETIPEKIVCKRKQGVMEKVDKIGEIVHVHGKIDIHPIIGVNDVSQINNEELAKDQRFKKCIVKPLLNKYLRLGNDSKATNILKQSKIICIYGMSLGATDKKWWNAILQWLHHDLSRQLVIFEYDNDYSTNNQFSWIEKEDEVIDKLSQYNNTSIKVEDLYQRIHIAIHKNIFKMQLMKKIIPTDKKYPFVV